MDEGTCICLDVLQWRSKFLAYARSDFIPGPLEFKQIPYPGTHDVHTQTEALADIQEHRSVRCFHISDGIRRNSEKLAIHGHTSRLRRGRIDRHLARHFAQDSGMGEEILVKVHPGTTYARERYVFSNSGREISNCLRCLRLRNLRVHGGNHHAFSMSWS